RSAASGARTMLPFGYHLDAPIVGLQRLVRRHHTQNHFSHWARKVHKDKMALMVEVIFSALVDDPDEVVLLGSSVLNDWIDFPDNQIYFVVEVIDTAVRSSRLLAGPEIRTSLLVGWQTCSLRITAI